MLSWLAKRSPGVILGSVCQTALKQSLAVQELVRLEAGMNKGQDWCWSHRYGQHLETDPIFDVCPTQTNWMYVLLVKLIWWSWGGLIQMLPVVVANGWSHSKCGPPVWLHLPWWQLQKHRFQFDKKMTYLQIIIMCWYCNFSGTMCKINLRTS